MKSKYEYQELMLQELPLTTRALSRSAPSLHPLLSLRCRFPSQWSHHAPPVLSRDPLPLDRDTRESSSSEAGDSEFDLLDYQFFTAATGRGLSIFTVTRVDEAIFNTFHVDGLINCHWSPRGGIRCRGGLGGECCARGGSSRGSICTSPIEAERS